MKYLFAALGAAISLGINHFSPEAFAQLIKVAGFYAGVAAIGTVFTAGWVVCLSKLSAFEKIDELPSIGRDKIIDYSRSMRRIITLTIIFNCLFALLVFVTIFGSQVEALDSLKLKLAASYVVTITLGFWFGGSIDSWRCYNAIDGTKEELILAQLEMKARKAFLAKLRKDFQDYPVSRDDPHLNGYTKNV
jgi:hypothetical protein